MKTKFKTYAVGLLSVFLLGTLYGALVDHCLVEVPLITGPATGEEMAQMKASITSPLPAPAKVVDVTNANPAQGRE